MLVGREAELSYLQQVYEKTGNQLLIVYGQKNIGKTSLLLEFAKIHPHLYYLAHSCSETMQLQMLQRAFLSGDEQNMPRQSFETLFRDSIGNETRKIIMIMDEFQLLVKSSDRFISELNTFLEYSRKEVMIILASSSIGWVENTMVRKMGRTALKITGLYKVRELSVTWIRKMFPSYSMRACLMLYGVTGGVPGILREMDPSVDIEQNICRVLLKTNSFGRLFGEGMLLDDLRETGVYNTILETLASGRDKLNDIYIATAFSRAKISVYMKNLIQLEIVEKVFSYDTDGRENAKKGVYRIQNKFAAFWYTYVFPNLSKLEEMSEELFYETYIRPTFLTYLADAYREICASYLDFYLDLPEAQELLHFQTAKTGEWVGKTGNIDMIREDESGKLIAGFCKCGEMPTTYEDLEWDLFNLDNAKLSPDYLYLFSMKGFDERIVLEAEKQNNLFLVDLEHMNL
ncbi:MAG: ATP-binding protein [Lachnospiraceae bacterium]|nr:ATP-binding protein [Lachnospiraceae bacterium]